MKVSRLALRGVASLPDLECDLVSATTGRPHDLVVISGPPASGKTRLCEVMLAAIETVGPYLGVVRAADWYADPVRGARVELGLWLDEAPSDASSASTSSGGSVRAVVDFDGNGVRRDVDRAVARRLSRYDHDPAHGKREYFPEGRQRAWGARQDGLGAVEQSLLRSSKDPQKYSFVPGFLEALRGDAERARTFAAGLELLSPSVRYLPAPRGKEPTACFANLGKSGVAYAELSSSEADAVLIAATAALIGLHHSVVFLDRPELHVSPDRLVGFVQNLARLGQGNQWFVATSDPGLVASVDKSQHISLAPADLQSPAASRRPS